MKRIFLLDTNIISELFKNKPELKLIEKINQNEKLCAISSTTWNELLYGAQIMPDGKRKDFIFSKLIEDIQSTFPIIQFDSHTAWIQADLRSRLKEKGMPIDYPDTEIAATAISNQMILITRNTKHFEPIQQLDSIFHIENWFEEEKSSNDKF